MTASYACRSDRVHSEVGTQAATPAAEVAPPPVANAEPRPSLENSRRDYNVDLTAARAHAQLAANGTGSIRGVAAIIGQKLVVQVAEAKPGNYSVLLNSKEKCLDPKEEARLAPTPNGTKDEARGDMVLGLLKVGQDGRGRVEAILSEDIWLETGSPTGSLVIQSETGEGDTAAGELTGSIACGELSTGEKGA